MKDSERQRIFDEWLSKHKGLMFKVVRAYSFTAHDREDLFQEIAIQLWNSIPKFREDSAVTTWIYRVALNTALTWTRKEKKQRDTKSSLIQSEQILTQTPTFKDNRLEWIYEQISQLDEVDRSLTLLMLDGFSYKEIAAIIGITESNVGVKINRIKKRLIEKIQAGD
ncbi:sigma-70 family RNA polymerase sigma factor [Rubellicoccus peritrichatus]|uniref:Sigma-70 family RNA polymerase sigma factor n=1 Tax=Rubellicoccus peritrichatus TaxID=3080537 RepID=A0AAQ3LF95_9BACT|nr:sigma-70 family RNA polymerase sigma factor [Puniceicoccus sp. CR14]WOO42820.1 sigma-70 family RNA polymerase sigma factor [Puniceicoccus sp. CR14]